eukprot:m.650085 g.650085  ORF g.650085 m.650085 type:complete len:259 (+) comp22669_c0_seq1:1909-2685(+)
MGELSIHGAYMARPFITWGCKKGLKEFWEAASLTMAEALGSPVSAGRVSVPPAPPATALSVSVLASTPAANDANAAITATAPAPSDPTAHPTVQKGAPTEESTPATVPRAGKKHRRHRHHHKNKPQQDDLESRTLQLSDDVESPRDRVASATSDDVDAMRLKTAMRLQREADELERITASLARRTASGVGFSKPTLNSSLVATFIDRDLSWYGRLWLCYYVKLCGISTATTRSNLLWYFCMCDIKYLSVHSVPSGSIT